MQRYTKKQICNANCLGFFDYGKRKKRKEKNRKNVKKKNDDFACIGLQILR